MPITVTELVESRAMGESRKEGRAEQTLTALYKIEGSDDPGHKDVQGAGPQSGDVWGDGSLGLVVISRAWEVLRATGSTGVIKVPGMPRTYGLTADWYF